MDKLNYEFSILQRKIDKGFIETVKTLRTQHSEVMFALKTQFTQIKNQLNVTFSKMGQIQISQYQGVELSVLGALNDMEFNSTLDLLNRAVTLCDGLKYFLTGMLGQNSIGGDILKIAHDLAITVSYSLTFTYWAYKFPDLSINDTIAELQLNTTEFNRILSGSPLL